MPDTPPRPVDPDHLDSREVYEGDELAGYALVETGWGRRPFTPVRCCRTCAWADAQHVVYVPGVGPAYRPPAAP